jgi:arylsulfatase A
VQRSLKFLEENAQRPFFLYVPLNLPHYPEQALKQYEELYRHIADPARRSYAAMISTTDHYVGMIMAKLEALKLRDNTIVIFMSDNGHSEEKGLLIRAEHHSSGLPVGHPYGASGGGNTGKWMGQKATFLEGGLRVPAIISYPSKLPQGVVRDQIVTVMDWYPTVLALCDVKRPADAPPLDGHNLLPLIVDESVPSAYGGVLHFAWRGGWAVREGEWKLILTNQPGQEKTMSLHNLAETNPEVKDYAAEKPEILARLKALQEKWLVKVKP